MLTSDKVCFAWDEKYEIAFNKLKEMLCPYSVLQYPKMGERFEVEVDGSDTEVGGVLLQADSNGKY